MNQPWCGQRRDGRFHAEHSVCAQQQRRVRATVTDHIRSIRTGGQVFDPANHQSLCVSCNTRKGRRDHNDHDEGEGASNR